MREAITAILLILAPIHDTGAKGLAVETAETSIENMGHLRGRNKARVQDPRRSRSP
jgi:hypothetical protein